MGGTLNMRGNVSPVAEANFAGDPRACDIVFQSGMDILTVGLDVTIKTRLTVGHMELLKRVRKESCRKAVEYMDQALTYYRKGEQGAELQPGRLSLHDPWLWSRPLHPELFQIQRRKARIECGGTYCKGMVVTDTREKPFQAGMYRLAVDVDRERAVAYLLAAFWEKELSVSPAGISAEEAGRLRHFRSKKEEIEMSIYTEEGVQRHLGVKKGRWADM